MEYNNVMTSTKFFSERKDMSGRHMCRLVGFKMVYKCWRELIVSPEMFNERLTPLMRFHISVCFLLTLHLYSLYISAPFIPVPSALPSWHMLKVAFCQTNTCVSARRFLGANITSGHSVGGCAGVHCSLRISDEMGQNQIGDMKSFSCFTLHTMQISFYLNAS